MKGGMWVMPSGMLLKTYEREAELNRQEEEYLAHAMEEPKTAIERAAQIEKAWDKTGIPYRGGELRFFAKHKEEIYERLRQLEQLEELEKLDELKELDVTFMKKSAKRTTFIGAVFRLLGIGQNKGQGETK
jgi:Ser/Thr protein kinase RdoA (MazF antagonist)